MTDGISYDYPVGKSDSYQMFRIDIDAGSVAGGLADLNVRFGNPADWYGTGWLALTPYDTVLDNGSPGGNGGVWTYTPNAGTANYYLELWGSNYTPGLLQLTQSIAKRTAPTADWIFAASTHISDTVIGGTVYVRRGASFSGFSQAAVVSAASPPLLLPVKMLYFTAYVKGVNVALEWATVSEENNDYFSIQRSKNGENFETIGTVDGAGTSNEKIEYQFIDTKPFIGMNYYMLKQTDYDGRYEYSDLVAVKFLRKLNFSVRPNPATDYLEITFGEVSKNVIFVMTPEYDAAIKIYDAVGELVYEKKFNGTFYKFNIDISPFSQGMYFVSLTANNELYKAKFVKE